MADKSLTELILQPQMTIAFAKCMCLRAPLTRGECNTNYWPSIALQHGCITMQNTASSCCWCHHMHTTCLQIPILLFWLFWLVISRQHIILLGLTMYVVHLASAVPTPLGHCELGSQHSHPTRRWSHHHQQSCPAAANITPGFFSFSFCGAYDLETFQRTASPGEDARAQGYLDLVVSSLAARHLSCKPS